DMFDAQVDSIRIFDEETQRSIEKVDVLKVLPAREIGLTDEAISLFRSNWRNVFPGNPAKSLLYNDISNAVAPAGIEYYLPLFYESTSAIFDYFSSTATVILADGVTDAAESFWQDVNQRYEQGRHDLERPLLPPEQIFFSPDDLLQKLATCPQISCSRLTARDSTDTVNFAATAPLHLPVDIHSSQPLAILNKFLTGFNGRILLVAESPGRRETILEMLHSGKLYPQAFHTWQEFLESDSRFGITIAALEQGTLIDKPHIAIISESQLFGERVQQRRLRKRRKQDSDAVVRSLAELTTGAPVVHEDNGVGRYQGLVTLEVGGILNEFICLEYDRGDKLYVPVSSLELISRYTGADPEHAPLHRLGSNQWSKARERAEKRVVDVAAELLELHARRAARSGNSFAVDENAYLTFVQGFP
ncbi:MAG: CarD family transcriptional regulator, partial [Gammaproteobacteria bacterium]